MSSEVYVQQIPRTSYRSALYDKCQKRFGLLRIHRYSKDFKQTTNTFIGYCTHVRTNPTLDPHMLEDMFSHIAAYFCLLLLSYDCMNRVPKKSFLSMHLLFLCAYRVENLRAQRLSPEVWQTVQNGASSIQHINIVSMLADIGLAFSAGIDVVNQFYFDSGCMSSPKTCVCRLIHAVLPRFQWSNSETNIVPPSNYFTVCNFLT